MLSKAECQLELVNSDLNGDECIISKRWMKVFWVHLHAVLPRLQLYLPASKHVKHFLPIKTLKGIVASHKSDSKFSKTLVKSREHVYDVSPAHFNKKLVKLESTIKHWNFRKLDERQSFWRHLQWRSGKNCHLKRKKSTNLLNAVVVKRTLVLFSLLIQLKLKAEFSSKLRKQLPLEFAEKVVKNIPESGAALSKATTNKTAVNDAQVLFNQINTHFKKIYHNLGFAEALAKVNEIHLQLKSSKNEPKKKSRKHYQSVKENDADTFLQTRISYNKR